jgi:hypothetical protein
MPKLEPVPFEDLPILESRQGPFAAYVRMTRNAQKGANILYRASFLDRRSMFVFLSPSFDFQNKGGAMI